MDEKSKPAPEIRGGDRPEDFVPRKIELFGPLVVSTEIDDDEDSCEDGGPCHCDEPGK